MEQWQKMCNTHGPYGEPFCPKCQAELNESMRDIAESIAEQAHAKEQERTMTQPTEQQLNDPTWWDENAPDDADYVAIAPDDTLIFYRKDRVGTWQIWGVRRKQWMFDGFSHDAGEPPYDLIPRPTKPEPKEWNGEGWPPVGCECECTFAVEQHDTWHKGRVVFSGIDPEGREFFIVDTKTYQACYRSSAHVRPIRTKEQRERDEVIEAAIKACPFPGSDSTRIDVEALYDAGMLRKGGE